jgi:uncharacterized protein
LSPANPWEKKLVRDPIHGFIGLSDREVRLAGTSAFLRLGRIHQLAHSYVVYPGAVHTRLEHSLGTLYVAGRIAQVLSLPDADAEALRAAALLHDVGHGAYSHLFEGVMRAIGREDFDHEIVAPMIIRHDTEVASALSGIGDRVSSILQKQAGLLSHIISGALDADKLDYLRRDAYYAGVSYGIFDIERILRSVCNVQSAGEDYLAVEWGAKDALENYRLARYSMHTQVYEHKTRLIADDLFVRAYWFAAEEKIVPKDDLLSADPNKFLPAYSSLDDASVEFTILQQSKGVAKEIIHKLRARKLLKRAYELPLTKQAVPDRLKRNELGKISRTQIPVIERELAKDAPCDAHWMIVHPQTIPIKLYERFDQKEGEDASALLIRRQDRMSVTSMEDESPITSLPEPIRRIFVFCPEECVRRVHELSVRMFGFPGTYTPPPNGTGPAPVPKSP